MGAALKDLTIPKGIDFTYIFAVKNYNGTLFDLTGYTIAAKIRPTPESTKLLATFTCSIDLNSDQGFVTISLSAVTTAALRLGTFHWDCIMTSPDAPDLKLLKGKAIIEATAST